MLLFLRTLCKIKNKYILKAKIESLLSPYCLADSIMLLLPCKMELNDIYIKVSTAFTPSVNSTCRFQIITQYLSGWEMDE